MNVFSAACIYMLIGGLIVGLFVRHEQQRCPGYEIKTSEYATLVVVWPALVASSLVIVTDGKVAPCEAKP